MPVPPPQAVQTKKEIKASRSKSIPLRFLVFPSKITANPGTNEAYHIARSFRLAPIAAVVPMTRVDAAPLLPGATELGENEHVLSDGKEEHANVTVPL